MTFFWPVAPGKNFEGGAGARTARPRKRRVSLVVEVQEIRVSSEVNFWVRLLARFRMVGSPSRFAGAVLNDSKRASLGPLARRALLSRGHLKEHAFPSPVDVDNVFGVDPPPLRPFEA